MKKIILLLSLSLFAVSVHAQTQKEKEVLMHQSAVPIDGQKEIVMEKRSPDIQTENYLTNSIHQSEEVTPEEDDEIKFMQNLNRERDINDCIMQLEMFERELAKAENSFVGIENSQMAKEVKEAKLNELQQKKNELQKRKISVNEKLESLEKQNKQNNK